MHCLGGEIQARLWPLSRREVQAARDHGIEDIEVTLRTADMAGGNVIFAATGVTEGEFLEGLQYLGWGLRTHSIVMCKECNDIRFIRTTHLNNETRREIRL